MNCLHIFVSVMMITQSNVASSNGWCQIYSRISNGLSEDVAVIKIARRRIPNCQWQVIFKNATKLEIKLQIYQMPFSTEVQYKEFEGIIHKQTFDTLKILSGDCYHGDHLMTVSGVKQKTVRKLNTNAVCFQYISNNEHYNENRLELRVKLSVLELQCKPQQINSSTGILCKTHCLPFNQTRTECHYPENTKPTSANLPTKPTYMTIKRTTPGFQEITSPPSILIDQKTFLQTKAPTTSKESMNFPLTYINSPLPSRSTYTVPSTTETESHEYLNPSFNEISKQSSDVTTTTQAICEQVSKTQMTDKDIYIGLYIASTIAGTLTVTIIILVICCVKNGRELKKMTEMMLHMKKSKQEHNKLHRQEFSSWSSVSSSLRPALPPRPIDLPGLIDSKHQISISPYHQNDQIYDNIGNIKQHKPKICNHDNIITENQWSKLNIATPDIKSTHYFRREINDNESGYHERILGIDEESIVGKQSIDSGEYIDSTSIKSTMYRKVHRFNK